MATERMASCVWHGELTSGVGAVSADSRAFVDLPVSWAARTGSAAGMTSPEELIAAAHAACFSMALSHGLTEAGYSPERLEVAATVTLDQVNGTPTVTASDLVVDGLVPGVDAGEFIRLATDAGRDCPISRALAGLDVRVTATLSDAGE